MKRLQWLLCLLLCLTLFCSFALPCFADIKFDREDGEDGPSTWALICQLIVCVREGTDLHSLSFGPMDVYVTRIAPGQQGDIYHFFGVYDSGDGIQDPLQYLAGILTEQAGVIDFCRFPAKSSGDVDNDQRVTAADALLCLQMAVGKHYAATAREYTQALPDDGREVLVPDAACD